jgi:hypothetical protein
MIWDLGQRVERPTLAGRTPIFHPLNGWNPIRLAIYEGFNGTTLLLWFGYSDKSLRLYI